MTDTTQATVFGEPLETTLSFATTGRVIRPFKQMVEQVADEYRLRFDDDGIHVSVVDSANVMGGDFHLHTNALESWEWDTAEIAADTDMLGTVLQHARYGISTDDAISVSATDEQIESSVTRDVGEVSATFTERAPLIDPQSVRQEPELPDPETDVEVSLPPRAFIDVVDTLDSSLATQLCTHDGEIHAKQNGDVQDRHVSLAVEPTGAVEPWTYYSTDYLQSITNGLHTGYVDMVTLRWAEDYPLFVEFEREGVYHGQYFVAPRLKPDD
jgi:hypothetical protein